MEKMNFLFLIIIIVYLTYSFFKREKKAVPIEKKIQNKNEGAEKNYERIVLTAAIAAVMEEKKFRVKNVFLVGHVDERKSSWRISGRQDSMMKRVMFGKK